MLLHCLSKNKRLSLHSLSLPGISITVILMTQSWMTPAPDRPIEANSLKWIFQKKQHCSFIVSISSQWHWSSLSFFLFWFFSCEIPLYLNFKNCDQTDINFHISFSLRQNTKTNIWILGLEKFKGKGWWGREVHLSILFQFNSKLDICIKNLE